jgi:menaquinone-dependent protoporphyrinogen oxidase
VSSGPPTNAIDRRVRVTDPVPTGPAGAAGAVEEVRSMTVLVAYASRHGATRGIAERIGSGLEQAGLRVEVKPVDEIDDVERYDAFVIGSAAYGHHWLKEASAFVRGNEQRLAQGPVWLFSSGPIGEETVDPEGRDMLEISRPGEFDEFGPRLRPRGTRVFFGAWDPQAPPIGIAERLQRHLPAAWTADVVGDFRDWQAIDGWVSEIASELDQDRQGLTRVQAANQSGTRRPTYPGRSEQRR